MGLRFKAMGGDVRRLTARWLRIQPPDGQPVRYNVEEESSKESEWCVPRLQCEAMHLRFSRSISCPVSILFRLACAHHWEYTIASDQRGAIGALAVLGSDKSTVVYADCRDGCTGARTSLSESEG